MNAVQQAKREGVVDAFLARLGLHGNQVSILENPTEEILDSLEHGHDVELHGMRRRGLSPMRRVQKGPQKRAEENYLYSTRRFPNNTANNTIGAGAVTAADYDYFGNGVGDVGSSMGYFSLSNLTYLQTNMDKGGKIPSGRSFRLYELAVSFNAEAIGTDIAQCLDTMALRFEKQGGQLVIQHGPIRNWPGGVGLSGYAATTVSATSLQAASNGNPDLRGVRKFRIPRVLRANESFKYVINAAANLPNDNGAVALGSFVEICIWLYGYAVDSIPE